MQYKIDYLSFTIKPDKNALCRKAGKAVKPLPVRLLPLLRMIGFSRTDIEMLFSYDYGKLRNYDHTYILQGNGITVYACELSCTELDFDFELPPYTDDDKSSSVYKYYTYGVNIEMKGSGCRYFEYLHQDDPDCYRTLFGKLLNLVTKGAALNVTRLDFAFDDIVRRGEVDISGNAKQGLLDLDVINNIINNKVELENKLLDNIEVVTDSTEIFSSIYRTYSPSTSTEKLKYYDIESGYFKDKLMTGSTVYFGTRESSSYCKFYDKYVEQHSVHQDDLRYLKKELADITHWVRFEFTFKDEVAMKIVNAYLSRDDKAFMQFIGVTINAYLRFIQYDDKNITRCSLVDWWAEFIESVDHARILVCGIASNPAAKALNWVGHNANIFDVLIRAYGAENLLKYIQERARPECYTGKHKAILKSKDFTTVSSDVSNLDMWIANIPVSKAAYESK